MGTKHGLQVADKETKLCFQNQLVCASEKEHISDQHGIVRELLCMDGAAYQDIIVDELVNVVCITTIVHGVLQGSQVLAMHV